MKTRGFTLIELLVVISIIGLLSSVVLAGLDHARAKSRDAKRALDMNEIVKALYLHASDNDGEYPKVTYSPGGGKHGGWEASDEDPANFIESLHKYFGGKTPVDPINRTTSGFNLFIPTGNFYYQYYRYGPNYSRCPDIKGRFAVIAVHEMETSAFKDKQVAICGNPELCSHPGGCEHGRNWNTEADYSVILIE